MEIEKTVVVPAPASRVWELLLDPQVMGGCVPGMQSIQVISDVEYIAEIKVKVSFISAKFKLKTTIVEQRAPHYLRTEGTGEDTSVASSLKQTSEIFLTELPDGQTELRILVKVDVLGRLGTFGLSAMKTKADRMWDEFTEKLVARITATGDVAASGVKVTAAPAKPPVAAKPLMPTPAPMPVDRPSVAAPTALSMAPPVVVQQGVPVSTETWWSRWFGRSPKRESTDICIEIHRGDTVVKVLWPVAGASHCSQWLRDYLVRPE
ncbi:CoxG family protein [Variovorax boronicumulans]|uniref:CoxG family protein n=1 Tax=Variovorax boronicumulans TaxID=436515 RepID=UPI0027D91EBA|nr:SRPBCC family protein [Variovorax boronicumulans]